MKNNTLEVKIDVLPSMAINANSLCNIELG